MQALISDLFSDTVHPFYEPFSQFVEEYRSETAERSQTSALVFLERTASKRFQSSARRWHFFNMLAIWLVAQVKTRTWRQN
jgi:hypothetical protein